MEHTWYECKCGHVGCQFCDGGLGYCTVCKGFEGTLSTNCTGKKLSEPTLDAIWKGYIDFVDGRWVTGRRWRNGKLYSWKEYYKRKMKNE